MSRASIRDGDAFQQGDLRALVEGFKAGSMFTAHFYSFCIKVGISLDPSADRDRCLMPWTWKQNCLEFLRPWRSYDWNKPDEKAQRVRWLEKEGFV